MNAAPGAAAGHSAAAASLMGGGRVRVVVTATRKGDERSNHDRKQQAELLDTRKKAVPFLFQRDDGLQPIPFVEDAAVPPENLQALAKLADEVGVPWTELGATGGDRIRISSLMDVSLHDATDAWRNGFARAASDEKEAILAALEIERWLAESCREVL